VVSSIAPQGCNTAGTDRREVIYLMIGFYIAGAYMMLDAAHEANGSKFDLFGAVAAIFWPIVSLF
jgi:hypothetical protein